jgi:hypothetical protein
MRNRCATPPRRTRGPQAAHQARTRYEAALWRAARHGLALTRDRGVLGTLYTLVSPTGGTVLLYDLAEVHDHLDRLGPPSTP